MPDRGVYCLWRNPGQQKNVKPAGLFTLSDPEHLCAASRTNTLGRGPSIFHCDFFGVFHFTLGFAFNAISFHLFTSLNYLNDGSERVNDNVSGKIQAHTYPAMDSHRTDIACDFEFYTQNNKFSNTIKQRSKRLPKNRSCRSKR